MSTSISQINQLAERMITATRDFVSRAVDPLKTRLATVEVRSAALAMLAAGQGDAEKLREFESLAGRIAALEDRIVSLTNKPSLTYAGTWSPETEFNAGAFVTFQGSIWYTKRKTRGRPGACDDFQLAVKRGTDGKDLR